jgi:two-component system phosphate regulon response regulator PhoB
MIATHDPFDKHRKLRSPGMKRILVIDDDIRHDKMMSYLLISKGFESFYALSGSEAIEKIASGEIKNPDIILMDIMMPGMNGFEAIAEIRKVPDLKTVPIVMMSAVATPEHIDKANELNVADFIEKPFSPSDVIARINAVIEKAAN